METRKYVPIEEQGPLNKERVGELETSAETISRIRTEILGIVRKRVSYFPKNKNGGVEMTPREIVQAVKEEKDLMELLDWSSLVDKYAQREDFGTLEAEMMMEDDQEEIVDDFIDLAELYDELALYGSSESEESSPEMQFFRLRNKELSLERKTRESLLDQFHRQRFKYNYAVEKGSKPKRLERLREKMKEVMQELEAKMEGPDGYMAVMTERLIEMKNAFDENGKIVETPYVKMMLSKISDLIASDRPVFLFGELGSGKTEVAKYLARTKLSKPHLDRWVKGDAESGIPGNPPPTPPERTEGMSEEEFAQAKAQHKKERAQWAARMQEQAEPIVYSGHKTSEPSEFLVSRVIGVAETKDPEEYASEVRARVDRARQEYQAHLSRHGITEPGAMERWEEDEKPLLIFALKERYKSPVETSERLGKLLAAMYQGRPLIIDEMNAIPHHTLILMNDLLTKKTGDWVDVPYLKKPFQVKDGFSVIATGNYKPEDGVMYKGRQDMDAAFLSRFALVGYDYLPQRKDAAAMPEGLPIEEERARMAENELFQMLVTRLFPKGEKDLHIEAPEGFFNQIQRLAVVARIFQDIFSGRQVVSQAADGIKIPITMMGEGSKNAEADPRHILKENVLSLRHLIPIIHEWQREGYKFPLDYYIFKTYVTRSDARPVEKFNIYRLIKIQGDFFNGAEWPSATNMDDLDAVLHFNIDGLTYKQSHAGVEDPQAGIRQQTKTFTVKEIVEALFGRVPERTVLPESFITQAEAPKKEELTQAERMKWFDAMGDLKGLADQFQEATGMPLSRESIREFLDTQQA